MELTNSASEYLIQRGSVPLDDGGTVVRCGSSQFNKEETGATQKRSI